MEAKKRHKWSVRFENGSRRVRYCECGCIKIEFSNGTKSTREYKIGKESTKHSPSCTR